MPKKGYETREELSQKILDKLAAADKKPNQIISSTRLPIFHLYHRLWHIIFIIPILPLVCFWHILLILRKLFSKTAVFRREECYGKKGNLITIRYFNTKIFSNLALFYQVLSGKLSFTGYSMNTQREIGDAFIYDYAPGMINLWYIRSASRTAYEGIKETDKEFVSNLLLKAELNPNLKSFIKLIRAEFMLLIRFMVARTFRSFQKVKHLPRLIDPIFLFNTRLRNVSMQQTLNQIKVTINREGDISAPAQRKIYFVNPDCFNKIFATANSDYKEILQNSAPEDWIFADGIGINIAADMLGYPKNENVNGTDLLPRLVELVADNGFSLFLLGAKAGVADKMKESLRATYPQLNIKGTQHGYFDWDTESAEIVQRINQLKVDILLVAFGAPFQELWIDKWFPKLNCSLTIGVGGLFDFYSGRMKRAPRWLRDIGLEWVFRLIMEPKRMFHRYIIGNPVFLNRVKNIQKTAAWIIRKIKISNKNKVWQIIDLTQLDIIIKRHTSLMDMFPLIADYCADNKIPVCLLTKNPLDAQKCLQNLRQSFLDVKFYNDLTNLKNIFCLIITNPENNAKIDILKTENNCAICLIDKHFINEFTQISILD